MGRTLNDFQPLSVDDRQISPTKGVEPSAMYESRPDQGLSQVRGTRNSMRPESGGGTGRVPLKAFFDSVTGEMSALGAFLKQEGVLLPWQILDGVAATVGTYLYLKILQNSDVEATTVSLEVKTTAYDDILVLDESAPYHVTEARVLIAQVVDGKLEQYFTGNLILYLEQSGGSVTRWPTTVGGSPPPPPVV